jgi:hypothetical protein
MTFIARWNNSLSRLRLHKIKIEIYINQFANCFVRLYRTISYLEKPEVMIVFKQITQETVET